VASLGCTVVRLTISGPLTSVMSGLSRSLRAAGQATWQPRFAKILKLIVWLRRTEAPLRLT